MNAKIALEKTLSATYWIKLAQTEDSAKAMGFNKRKDGYAEWLNAAHELSILTGMTITADELKIACYSK